MKANFIYSNLNPCGGGERFTLVTMHAVTEMGIEIELTTLENPNISKLENAFGKDLASVMKQLRKINVLQMFDQESVNSNISNNDYDIIINTHGDIDPYYNPGLTKENTITYCHYPSAKSFIEEEDANYFEYHLRINRINSSFVLPTSDDSASVVKFSMSSLSPIRKSVNHKVKINDFDKKRQYIDWVKYTYDKMIRNSLLITNSYYSRRAIFETYGIDDIVVLSPPVDVDAIRTKVGLSSLATSASEHRDNLVLVICRIEPSKKIENAVYLARRLKERKIRVKMIMAGSLDPFYQEYYDNLKKLIADNEISDNILFRIDTSFEELIELMKGSKVFFHPREGEHFGMSIVEAMSAGLVPVVPSIGGQTEFVPTKYQYSSLEQALQIVTSALDITDKERHRISDSVRRFSETNYKRQFQLIISKLIYDVGIIRHYDFHHLHAINK